MRIATIFLRSLAILLGSSAAADTAHQPYYIEPPTLEWRVVSSDLVLTARITGVEASTAEVESPTVMLTLEPVEAIKGNPPAALRVIMPNPRYRATLAEGMTQRMDSGTIDLWFLTFDSDTLIAGPINGEVHESLVCLTDPPATGRKGSWLHHALPPLITRDGSRHDGPTAAVDAARRVVAMGLRLGDIDAPVVWTGNDLPRLEGLVSGREHRASGLFARLTAPWLEPMARQMATDPASFFPPLDPEATDDARASRDRLEAKLRADGVRILSTHFLGRGNTNLFYTMLNDRSMVLESRPGLAEPAREVFAAAREAYGALSRLGYALSSRFFEWPVHFRHWPHLPAHAMEVHDPRFGLIGTVQFEIELSGDQNPELLRVSVVGCTFGSLSHNVRPLHQEGAHCTEVALYRFETGEPILVFHRQGGPEGFSLTLHEHDGSPVLLVRMPESWDTRIAYGWWPSQERGGRHEWAARVGDWDYHTATFTPTGAAEAIEGEPPA